MCAAAPRPARTPYQRTHAHETDECLLCLADKPNGWDFGDGLGLKFQQEY